MSLSSPLLLFVVSTAITPGPNNAMLLASGLNHGIRKSVPHLVGVNCGFAAMVVLIGLGLGTLFEAVPAMHDVIQVCGVLYLIYLAWLIASTPTGDLEREAAEPLSVWQAAAFQWINPKALVMATGAIATFSSAGANMYVQVLTIAGTFFVAGTPCSVVWLLGGASMKRLLMNPKHRRAFNVVLALLLVTSIIPAALEIVSRFPFP